MVDENKRIQILEMIERGEITPDEGLRLLQELNSIDEPSQGATPASEDETGAPLSTPAGETGQVTHINELQEVPEEIVFQEPEPVEIQEEQIEETDAIDADEPDQRESTSGADNSGEYSQAAGKSMPDGVEKWRRWWIFPLYVGIGITVVGGLFMLWAFQASGIGFWFFCTSIFFAFGLLVLILAAQSRTARWLHLRVKQKPGERPQTIAISFPLPLRFASWILRIFGRYIPDVEGASASDILTAMDAVDDEVSVENPIYIQVDDEDGEHVEIFIG